MGEKFYIPCSCRVVGKAARMIFKEFGTPENVSEWDSTDFAQAAAFKDGGISNGFIILTVNDKPMKTISDLQDAVKDASTSKTPVLFITGEWPSGKTDYKAVNIGTDK